MSIYKKGNDTVPRLATACTSVNLSSSNKSKPLSLDSSQEERAIKTIITAIRRHYAEKSYKDILSAQALKGSKHSSWPALDYIKFISKLNISNLRMLLVKLDKEERLFLASFLEKDFKILHASDANLINEKGNLSLFSRQKLQQKNIPFNEKHSTEFDISNFGNDDFVFFSLEPGLQNIMKPSSRFGQTLYSFNLKHLAFKKLASVVLDDFAHIDSTKNVKPHIIGLKNDTYKKLSTYKLNLGSSIFFAEDILPGIAFTIINMIRTIPSEERIKLLALRTEEEMNRLVNGLMRPEIRVPNSFFSRAGNFKQNYFICSTSGLEKAKKNKEDFLTVVRRYGQALRYASEDLQDDKDIVLAAISNHAEALEYASKRFRNDKDIVLTAVSNNGQTLQYASEDLQGNKDIVLAAVRNNGGMLWRASKDLQDDKDIVLAAISNHAKALKYASERFRNDKDIVLTAVSNNGQALQYASKRFRNDKDIVLAAVSNNGQALQYASEDLQDDKDIVLATISNHAKALQYASERFRNDKDIVLAAVSNNGQALQYASECFRNDKDIVLAAVSNNGQALLHVGDTLRDNLEIQMAAIQQNPDAIRYASHSFAHLKTQLKK